MAHKLRLCNELATNELQDMRILAARDIPIIPQLTMNHYSYFTRFQKVAATIMSIIQINNEQ